MIFVILYILFLSLIICWPIGLIVLGVFKARYRWWRQIKREIHEMTTVDHHEAP